MINNRLYIITALSILFISFLPIEIFAQQNYDIKIPEVIPPSPNAMALGRYGDHPVSLSTGVPEISIPIFTIQQADITIPISISYHASGIKVTDETGSIGLGWILNAGGRVSRFIVGKPDEFHSFPNPLRSESSINLTWNDYLYLTTIEDYDTEYDIFSYSLPNVTGKFILEAMNPVMLNHEPVKISLLSNHPLGFDITDANNIQYLLKEIEITDTHASSWLLTTVKSKLHPKDSVHFEYRQGRFDTRAWNRFCIIDELTSHGNSNNYLFTPTWVYDGTSSFVHITREISEISFANGKITFSANTTTGLIERIDIYGANNELIKRVLLKQSLFPGQSSRYKLDEVCFHDKNNTLVSKYKFDYNLTYSMPPHNSFAIDFWGYSNGKTNNTHFIPHQFMINGYNIGGADRSVNTNYVQTYMLKKITYPTGGYSTFEFESNRTQYGLMGGLRIAKIETHDQNGNKETRDYRYGINESGLGRSIVDLYYPDNYFYCQKRWIDNNFTYLPSRRFLFSENPIVFMMNTINEFYYERVCEYLGTVTNNSGKTEYVYSPTYITDRPVISSFPNIHSPYLTQKYIPENRHWYPPMLQSKTIFNKTGSVYEPVYQQYIYYLEKDLKKTTGFHLYRFNIGLDESHPLFNPTTEPNYYYGDYHLISRAIKPSEVNEKYFVNGQATVQKQSKYYYENESHFLPTKQTVTESNGDTITTFTKYVADIPSPREPYATMILRNMFGNIVEEEQKLNGNFLSGKYIKYKKDWFLDQKVIAPDTVLSQTKDQNLPEPRLRYHKYDSYGNPAQVSYENGPNISYLWGYKGQYPIAKIENAKTGNYAYVCDSITQSSSLLFNIYNSSQNSGSFRHAGGNVTVAINGPAQSAVAYSIYGPVNTIGGTVCSDNTGTCMATNTHYSLPKGVYQVTLSCTSSNCSNIRVSVSYMERQATNCVGTGEQNEFFYAGFEEDASAITGIAAAGVKYHQGSYTVPYIKTNSRQYRIDYRYLENDVWKYKQATYTNQMNLSDGTAIDEVRVYPVDALMTTYTYKPLVGMTSETDPSGRIIFYEYDDFGRLKRIKDEEGKILQEYDYHYYNE